MMSWGIGSAPRGSPLDGIMGSGQVNSRRRDLRPHRTLEFSYGAFTPQETKGCYTPPWNPSTRFPPASWGVYSAKIKFCNFCLLKWAKNEFLGGEKDIFSKR